MAGDRLDGLFSNLFRDLAIAWRALSAYPAGHPAAVNGLTKACAAIGAVLVETGPLELAATRDSLLWQERQFLSPTAAQLAKLLRRRRAAGVVLEPGVTREELDLFLRALALDAKSARDAGSLAAELAAAGLAHLRVHDLDFSAVGLVEGDEEMAPPEAGALANRLIRKLLASGGLPPAALAAWITSGKSAAELMQLLLASGGTDPALAGWGPEAFAATLRLAIEDFCEAPDADRASGIAALHHRLRTADRERWIVELASGVARHAPTAEAAQSTLSEIEAALPADAAVDLRLAASRAAATEAAAGPANLPGAGELAAATASPPRISAQQLAQLRLVFAAEDLDAARDKGPPMEALEELLALPEDSREPVLQPAAAEVARELGDAATERTAALTLLELALRFEVGVEELPAILARLETTYRRLLSSGRLRLALVVVDSVQQNATGVDARPTAFRRLAERLSGRESLQALVGALPEMLEETLALVPELLHHLGPTAVRHLLGVLAETDNRRLRHLLMDLLARLGPAVVRDATALLADPRWYVVRNMLLLLRRVGDPGSVPAVRKCADHADLRVRLEAIRNLFAFDPEVPRELPRRALTHPDPRQAEAAMELAGEHGIAEAVAPIVDYLQATDLFGRRRSVRLKALRALAAIGDPTALDGLGRFRARFQLLPPALEERRELYRTLGSYPPAARRDWVERGLRSHDAEIRRLAGELAREIGSAP